VKGTISSFFIIFFPSVCPPPEAEESIECVNTTWHACMGIQRLLVHSLLECGDIVPESKVQFRNKKSC